MQYEELLYDKQDHRGLTRGAWLPLVGIRRTKDFALLHGTMTGVEAAEYGWATRSVSPDRLDDTVDRMAAEIARVPLEILMMKKLAIISASITWACAT
jgi:enoyl-CoA hydratase